MPAPVPGYLRAQPDGLLLSVKVQPRASRNKIGPAQGGELKVYVTAPPVDAAANEALIQLLADILNCARNQIEIMHGHKARRKILKLSGMTVEAVISGLK
ncbi:MAG TPA: DUF167 domain-containing protein [Verrucomicrobiae bacterium]|nr:DUF167 domain-containing protein [Verrucomicrobiae bacterium]